MSQSDYNIKLIIEAQNKASAEIKKLQSDFDGLKKKSESTFSGMGKALA